MKFLFFSIRILSVGFLLCTGAPQPVQSMEHKDSKETSELWCLDELNFCNAEGCSKLKRLPSREELLNHIQKNHPERNIICPNCCYNYTRTPGLTLHLSSYVNHWPNPKDILFCNNCEEGPFKSRQGIVEHVNAKHTENKYICYTCCYNFDKYNDLASHYKDFPNHKILPTKINIPDILENYDHEQETQSMKRFDVCNADGCSKHVCFESREELLSHIQKIHPERNIICPSCCLNYKRPGDLTIHLQNHPNHWPDPTGFLECNLCDSSVLFKTRIDILNHVKKHPQSLLCHSCCHSFYSNHEREKHYMNYPSHKIQTTNMDALDKAENTKFIVAEKSNGTIIISDDEEEACKSKEKNPFPTKAGVTKVEYYTNYEEAVNLLEKEYDHKQVKSYQCNAKKCSMKFKKIEEILSHVKEKHRDRPFFCLHCGVSYQQLNALNKHRKNSMLDEASRDTSNPQKKACLKTLAQVCALELNHINALSALKELSEKNG